MFFCICYHFFKHVAGTLQLTSMKEIAKEENNDDAVSENVSTSGDERGGV